MNAFNIVIVGAGQAGATAAAELRQQGFDGRIVLIGEEPHRPYERPPLSKDALLKPQNTRCQIHADGFYEAQRIELKLGTIVTSIDAGAYTVVLNDGQTLTFEKLLLDTGARVRRLPLLDQLGSDVYTLRTFDDTQKLVPVLQPGRRIVLAGGGVIGLELASTAVDLGVQVTVIEQAPKVMARSLPDVLRDRLVEAHRARGVRFHLGARLTHARRKNSTIVLTLNDGTEIAADSIIYGIGVEPETELARKAGLAVDDGILVDGDCRTSHLDIYAAGDAARQWDPSTHRYLVHASRNAATAR